jgi:hypothetical protein
MRRLLVASAALLVLSWPSATHAYTLMGVGSRSCGDWIADRRSNQFSVSDEEQWVLGFINGFGYSAVAGDPGGFTDANGVLAWMDKYCAAHTTENLADAAEAFVTFAPVQKP